MSLRHRHGYAAAFTVASRQHIHKTTQEFAHQHKHRRRVAHRTRPISARFVAGKPLRDVEAGSCRTPLHHARRTRTIWQC